MKQLIMAYLEKDLKTVLVQKVIEKSGFVNKGNV